MTRLLIIGLGGFLGSVARYLLSGFVQAIVRSASFPYGTLAVNVVGCFCIGGLSYLAEARGALSPDTRAFLIVGVLGGFTTFSAFGNETLALTRDAELALASLNVVAHIALGLAAVWLGRVVAYLLWG